MLLLLQYTSTPTGSATFSPFHRVQVIHSPGDTTAPRWLTPFTLAWFRDTSKVRKSWRVLSSHLGVVVSPGLRVTGPAADAFKSITWIPWKVTLILFPRNTCRQRFSFTYRMGWGYIYFQWRSGPIAGLGYSRRLKGYWAWVVKASYDECMSDCVKLSVMNGCLLSILCVLRGIWYTSPWHL